MRAPDWKQQTAKDLFYLLAYLLTLVVWFLGGVRLAYAYFAL